MYNVKKKTCLGVFFEIEENEAMAMKTSLKEGEVIEIEKTTSAFHIRDARSPFAFVFTYLMDFWLIKIQYPSYVQLDQQLNVVHLVETSRRPRLRPS